MLLETYLFTLSKTILACNNCILEVENNVKKKGGVLRLNGPYTLKKGGLLRLNGSPRVLHLKFAFEVCI